MMEQYIEIRAANPDCLLFYRMGDFYELFFGDAEVASQALGITLTKRGKHLGAEIPMCGVPVHAADDYLQRLIALGYRVAVCEQIEDPAKARARGSKAVVRRAVTRLVTPGTITEERLLESGRHNYLAAIAKTPAGGPADRYALAWMDISTGEFVISACEAGGLPILLARVEPREVLAPEKIAHEPGIRAAVDQVGAALTPLPAAFFDAGGAAERLAEVYRVKTIEAFGSFSRPELSAAAALVAYAEKTQVAKRPPLEPPKRLFDGDFMRLDAATRGNLELLRTISGARKGSLLAAIDRTVTAAGARLLAERLGSPGCSVPIIEGQLDAVAFFFDRPELRAAIRRTLGEHRDLHRALSRLGLERGGPRDLDCVRAGLDCAREIDRLLRSAPGGEEPPITMPAAFSSDAECVKLARDLADALADDLPVQRRDGHFIRSGYHAALDEARALRDESRRVIAGLQSRYAAETGVRSLKIRHNNVLGYFVEVTAAQASALQTNGSAGRLIHRQTLASAMRFSTAELADLEQRIASAADRALAIEQSIFEVFAARIAAAEPATRAAARALAEIDVAAALAELAAKEGYVRPKIDSSLAFNVEGGRHPVVEQALKEEGGNFIANDCRLGEAPTRDGDDERASPRIWLLTGPNMAGKSTFLRQNALIAILAQAGSFVPASKAHIGVVDAVFSRVGAADDLARGRSTFMVEMVETAAILNQAGPRSLVILDEIGRGTATFDGLSIAWAVIEHLHGTNRARALFATHYHELTALTATLPRLVNVTMKVKEWKGDVVFLHEVVHGAADRSYGIQVAKLAGLPTPVIGRARQILQSLEKSDRSRPKVTIDELPLFSKSFEEEAPHPVLAALEAVVPDDLSPRDALEEIYALKRLLKKDG